MQGFSRYQILPLGFTIFAMFFGAGNIVFPLVLGQYAQNQSMIAVFGLSLTAVFMPILGFIAMVLYDGDYNAYFKRIGRIPGFLLALFIITLLGPLGSAPRCLVIAHSTFAELTSGCSLPIFSAIASILVYFCTIKKRFILTLLGWVLTPMLLLSLLTIIVMGIFTGSEPAISPISKGSLFFHGLEQGYHTMDLLAALFFSSNVLKAIKGHKNAKATTIWASLIGGLLLCATYVGFCKVASLHPSIPGSGDFLGALAMKIAGPYGGILVCITVTLACLTTAIALVSSFAHFIQKEVFGDRECYKSILATTLVVTFFVSTFDFSGISTFLGPILRLCYPGLIVLTLVNIGAKMIRGKRLA
ncbi:MAG: branched-chain amino acid transport system II carrier protein [Simkaniaceae bacterium]|nr:branched-chain amino acid transport system II carrier protein [Simkaniaceae bacterium]